MTDIVREKDLEYEVLRAIGVDLKDWREIETDERRAGAEEEKSDQETDEESKIKRKQGSGRERESQRVRNKERDKT